LAKRDRTSDEVVELARRLERIRKLCDDLDKALGSADEHRRLLAQMKADADAALKALTDKS
jgi:hypothetical protein